MSSHGSGGKIRTILVTVLILLGLGLLFYWFVTGGPQKAWQAGGYFTNPVGAIFDSGTTTSTGITLPWQITAPRGPDISGYVTAAEQNAGLGGSSPGNWPGSSSSNLAQYGTPSPYAGEVTITGNNVAASDPSQEYIEIRASSDAPSPVTISGWVLQSAVSGTYAVIPQAADPFIGGIVNTVRPVTLPPGGSAIITTAASPVGVSLRENNCTGYLNQLQSFSPRLASSCPAPNEVLPQTAGNLRLYGNACFDYLNTLPSCYFPGANLPSDISKVCGSYLATSLSYNGCVQMYQSRSGFALPAWRLYFGLTHKLWNTSHDVIRLLDDQERVVDVLSY